MADRKVKAAKSTSRSNSSHPGVKRAAPSPRVGKVRPKKKSFGYWLGRVLMYVLIVILVLAIGAVAGGYIYYSNAKLPDPNAEFGTQTTSIYYRDSTTKIGDLSIQNRTVIDYTDMPDAVKDAVVAAEDRTFWTNKGISPSGMVRAVWSITRGGEVQGGSTITQQYIKIRYLNSNRTMSRKLQELALAAKMNNKMSKQDILVGYLNTIYFGRGAYGVEKAAETFFNVPAKQLTIPQSAVLAAMLNNPSLYDPATDAANAARLLDRYDYVLDGILIMGKITQAEHDKYYDKLPPIAPIVQSDTYGGPKGFLMNLAQEELLANGFTSSQINGGGLKIVTTFDATMQDAAVKIAQQYTQEASAKAPTPQNPANLHAAIASVGVGTGEVYALYGGPDYVASQINWATTPRMAASTFKAWTLIAALRQGFGLNTMLNGSSFTPSGDSTPVNNDSNVNYGRVNLMHATAYSMNTAFTDLVSKMTNGPAAVVQAANDAGVVSGRGWDLNQRIALGTAEVSPLSNATGFATIANDGMRVPTHVVMQVKDASGKVVYAPGTMGTQSLENGVARTAQTALKAVVTSGTGTTAQKLDREVIAKTGTAGVGKATEGAWFVGATKQIATAVEFVAGDGTGNLDAYRSPGYASFSSGVYPAKAWLDYMQVATNGQPVETFNSLKAVPGISPRSQSENPVSTTRATLVPSANEPTDASAQPTAPAPAAQLTSATVPATTAPVTTPAPLPSSPTVHPTVHPTASGS